MLLANAAHAAFDLSKLSTYSTAGDAGLYYRYNKPGTGLVRISPWHDIPFTLGKDDKGVPLLSFVCEIPRGTRAKFEIHKSVQHNPLLQDVHKNGTLREYVYSPAIINYGAITQTWEDPEIPDDDTKLGGDNDPIDVLQLNPGSCTRGAVQRVRVLGGLALVDDDETDWKLLVIDVDAKDAPAWRDVTDIPEEKVHEVREWRRGLWRWAASPHTGPVLVAPRAPTAPTHRPACKLTAASRWNPPRSSTRYRMYKTAEGKGENKYGLDERAVDAAHALRVAQHTHKFWADMMGKAEGGTRGGGCAFGKQGPCWTKYSLSAKDEL